MPLLTPIKNLHVLHLLTYLALTFHPGETTMCYFLGMRVSRSEYVRLKGIEKELRHLNMIRPCQYGFEYGDWPIVRPTPDRKSFTIDDVHWEFIPPSIRDEVALANARKSGIPWFAARSENLFRNEQGNETMWSKAAKDGRCLIPVTHFFEFRHINRPGRGAESIPYCITLKNRPEIFWIAGISQQWTNHSKNKSADTFAIVTQPANKLMSQIHNKGKRMPVILNETQAAEWLKKDLSQQRIQELAATSYNESDMIAWTVGKDFKTKANPEEPVHYFGIPALDYGLN